MNDYNGQEREIRETARGRYQVLPAGYTADDMTRAPVFASREEAEIYISRPMPGWIADERERERARLPYVEQYAAILQRPEFREQRARIQDAYAEAAHKSKLAGDAQRAAVRSTGQVSCMGRDIGAVRQGRADEGASEADETWAYHRRLSGEYETALQAAMRESGIPVELFRQSVMENQGAWIVYKPTTEDDEQIDHEMAKASEEADILRDPKRWGIDA